MVNDTKFRSRSKTAATLDKAIDDLISRKEKISISAVARAGGVTPGLIHNTYPVIADRIRSLVGKTVREQRDAQRSVIVDEKRKNKALRAEIDQLKEDLAKLASINQRLIIELADAKAHASYNVVQICSRK